MFLHRRIKSEFRKSNEKKKLEFNITKIFKGQQYFSP